MTLQLLVVDDHPLFREGIGAALRASGRDVEIVQAADAQEGLAAAETHPNLDAVLLDIALPGMNGLIAIREFRLFYPLLPVIILSALESGPNARRALAAGAAGFVPKSAPTAVILEALADVLAGGAYLPALLRGESSTTDRERAVACAPPQTPDLGRLTARQLEILAFMCRGKSNKEIAADFGLSEKTVKTHISAIFKVLGVVNRTRAVLTAQRMGLLTD